MKPRQTAKSARRKTLPPAERRALIAGQRLAAVKRFGDARHEGKTWAEASRIAGVSPATISRYTAALGQNDTPGLEPRTDNCGRKGALEKWHVTPEIVAVVTQLAREQAYSARMAWQCYGLSKDCPPTLSSHLLKSVPPSLITAVNHALA